MKRELRCKAETIPVAVCLRKETPCHLTLVTAVRWEDRTEETSQKTCLKPYNDAMLSGDRAFSEALGSI